MGGLCRTMMSLSRPLSVVLVAICCASLCTADVHSDLLSWAAKNKAHVDSVKIMAKGDGEYGLFATKALPRGSIAVSVPPELAMCPQNFVKSSLGKAMLADEKIANEVTLKEMGLLSVLLLGEVSNPESFWAPYIATLPKDVSKVVAVQLTETDLKLLDGTLGKNYTSEAVKLIQDMVAEIEAFVKTYDELIRKHYPKIDASHEKVAWAVAMVQSRQSILALQGDDAPKHGCLVPVMDFMNHRPNAVKPDMDDKDMFSQLVAQDVAEGAEVFTKYGDMSIELAFANYGFGTVEMASNMGPSFRALMERLLEDPELMQHGSAHAENVAKQLLGKGCQGIEDYSNSGVIGWQLLKRILQCTRILGLGPHGLEMLVRREPEEPGISERPFDYPAEVSAMETWIDFFKEYQGNDLEWKQSALAKKSRDALTPAERFAVDFRTAERRFIAGHVKELERLYKYSTDLADILEKEEEVWQAKFEESQKFKLTDDVAALDTLRAAEEKRVQDALEGSFDTSSIGGSGSHHDDF